MSSIVLALRQNLDSKIDVDFDILPRFDIGNYTILKVRENFFQHSNMHKNNLLLFADMAYDTESRKILKDRFGSFKIDPITNSIPFYPTELLKVYQPVVDIVEKNEHFDYLNERYLRNNLLTAIYLTDSYSKFSNYVDILELHLIRMKFGEQLQNDTIIEIYEKYPEKLI